MAKEKYISLKEAAGISGYSADYVGQLIRSGKLPGKQVFSNVAWMTTQDALEAYLDKQTKSTTSASSPLGSKDRLMGVVMVAHKAMLWGALVLFAAFSLLLIYIFSVTIDHQIDRAYLEKLHARP